MPLPSKFVGGLRNKLSIDIGHRLISRRNDDQYIVSYPRSGNTWLRAILTNLISPGANSNPDLFRLIVPGVSIRKTFQINALASPRILKSHTWFRREIKRAVYLVRDGRDVLVSLYHYLVTRVGRGDEESFAQFFDFYCRGYYGHHWHENVVSWLTDGRSILGDNLEVIHFEDLKSDTVECVAKIVDFLKLDASLDQIYTSIELTSLERMRSIERSRRGDFSNPNMSFYRGGKTGQWEDCLTPNLEQIYHEMASRAMILAGYEW
jgi:estrone sulfotransferase